MTFNNRELLATLPRYIYVDTDLAPGTQGMHFDSDLLVLARGEDANIEENRLWAVDTDSEQPTAGIVSGRFATAGPGGTSTGPNTQTWGYKTYATGNHAQAYGINVNSIGTNVAAIGRDLHTDGNRAGNVGADNRHYGDTGFTIGSGNRVGDSDDPAALVEVLGANNTVDSDGVTVVGSNNYTSGTNIRIYGNNNYYWGDRGSIIGIDNVAGDSEHFINAVGIIGQNNNIQASAAVVGVRNVVDTDGRNAEIFGNDNIVRDSDAIIYGNDNKIFAPAVSVFGNENQIDTEADHVIVIGNENLMQDDLSITIGFNNQAKRPNSVLVGRNIESDAQGVFLGFVDKDSHPSYTSGGDHNIFIGAGDTHHIQGDRSGVYSRQFGQSNVGIGSFILVGDSEASAAVSARMNSTIAIGDNLSVNGFGQVLIGSHIHNIDSDGEIRLGGTAMDTLSSTSVQQYPTVHPDLPITHDHQLVTKHYVDNAADSDTTYLAGYGLNLSDTEFSVDTEVIANRTWVAQHHLHVDSETLYTAGHGLHLIDTEFSVDTEVIASRQWVEDQNYLTKDSDTTYIAGYGLNLTDTEFSLDTDVVKSFISDSDTTYIAGPGLHLIDTEFSVDTDTIATRQWVEDQNYLTKDSDTTYTAGQGLHLINTEFSLDTDFAATRQWVEDQEYLTKDSDTTYTFAFDTDSDELVVTDSNNSEQRVSIPERTVATTVGAFDFGSYDVPIGFNLDLGDY